ncbi:hypothetical protein HWB51_gp078 [Mycobacterium phage Cuke]|uniref:Uncharacterized protein n=1 Tax=Mycobacterium phage Cuke TaxID=2079417 RepID=A0A2L1IX26_9CAUD|nr:hypothetical protein HWB51_gp078 [Mycobacterium phage Cuke]AVD99734.1 hypothetical protein SEA_CUKE_118 [Mycobacterium phage Cuke]
MSEIRCVGGYLDNVMVVDHGPEFTVLDYDHYKDVAEQRLPKGHPDLDKPMKYHDYTKSQGVYIHNESCCKTRQLKEFR